MKKIIIFLIVILISISSIYGDILTYESDLYKQFYNEGDYSFVEPLKYNTSEAYTGEVSSDGDLITYKPDYNCNFEVDEYQYHNVIIKLKLRDKDKTYLKTFRKKSINLSDKYRVTCGKKDNTNIVLLDNKNKTTVLNFKEVKSLLDIIKLHYLNLGIIFTERSK